ncbi:MAG: hypothetical protein JST43_08940 [Bacteroidetes bacterium]|nr:hypothetical protein [Bacteroidota bacterium]MBS1539468.1 hypothetical protein [Bacteroidota bacterium]
MKSTSKLAILQSLDELDQAQVENVLTYIKSLLQEPTEYQLLKKKALKEIRLALKQSSSKGSLQLLA